LAASVSQDQVTGSWLEDTYHSTGKQDSVLSLHTLNSEQYQQLLALLNKQHTEGVSSGNTAASWQVNNSVFLLPCKWRLDYRQ